MQLHNGFGERQAHARFSPGSLRLKYDLCQQVGDEISALGYLFEEDPVWDEGYGAVGEIMLGLDCKLYAGFKSCEETITSGR